MKEISCPWCGKPVVEKTWICKDCGCIIGDSIKAKTKGDTTYISSLDEGKKYKFKIEGKKLVAIYDSNMWYDDAKNLEIPNGVETIGKSAFAHCQACSFQLSSIKIPKSVKFVEEGAFSCHEGKFIVEDDCEAVRFIDGILYSGDGKLLIKATRRVVGKNIVIPEGVERIGIKAFVRLPPKTIKFPETLKSVGEYAFSACRFQSIELPESIEVIEKDAFSTSEIKEIYLPKNLRKIGQTALGYALEKIKISKENNYFKVTDGVLFSKSSKRLVLVERTKTGDYEIPKEVTNVDLGAFARLNLSVLTVYAHVKFHELDRFDFLGGKECKKVIKQ
jgi:hypothetical protein